MTTYGSVCSGIEAATVAWHPLGWNPAWFAEIESSPSSVLAHHYPAVPNLGDMTKIAAAVRCGSVAAPDVLVGGTPCQAFSVAGLRGGLADSRGQLTLSFVDLGNAIDERRKQRGEQPCTIVWENVPGVLSSADNAFGCFLAGLVGEGEPLRVPGGKWPNAGHVSGPQRTVAWRVLDAQYFGVAQRRRRVFVVASARKRFDPGHVLFEFDGLRRDTAPSRSQGQGIAATLDASFARLQGCSGQDAGNGHSHLVPVAFGSNRTSGALDVAGTLTASGTASGRMDFSSETFLVQPVLAFNSNAQPDEMKPDPNTTSALTCSQYSAALIGAGVRRLTPRECERLQAFPDDYTRIPISVHKQRRITKTRPAERWGQNADGTWTLHAADGPRYKALGNSMCVNVMRWIGRRVDAEFKRGTPAANDGAMQQARAA